jgi:hypothetical protein
VLVWGSLGALDDDDDLAARLLEVRQRLGCRAHEDLFMQLRQLAADGQASFPQGAGDALEAASQALWRLEDDQRFATLSMALEQPS